MASLFSPRLPLLLPGTRMPGPIRTYVSALYAHVVHWASSRSRLYLNFVESPGVYPVLTHSRLSVSVG